MTLSPFVLSTECGFERSIKICSMVLLTIVSFLIILAIKFATLSTALTPIELSALISVTRDLKVWTETSRLQLSLYRRGMRQNFLRDIKFSWQRRRRKDGIFRVFSRFVEPTQYKRFRYGLWCYFLSSRNRERIFYESRKVIIIIICQGD